MPGAMLRAKYGRFKKGYHRTGGYYGRFSGIHQERKFYDTTYSNASVDGTTGTIDDDMSDIAQGTTESTRIGRQCFVNSIHIKGHVKPAASTNKHERLRFIVVHDRQCNGALPNWTDIFTAANVDAYRNISNVHRFNILLDKTWTLNKMPYWNSTTTVYQEPVRSFFFNINLPRPGIVMEFSSTTGATTEKVTNNLLMMLISENDEGVDIDMRTRLRFTDNAKGGVTYARAGTAGSWHWTQMGGNLWLKQPHGAYHTSKRKRIA